MSSWKQSFVLIAAAALSVACAAAEPQDESNSANAAAPNGFKNEIIQRVEAFDAKQYDVLGFYPGMRRDEAFAATEALGVPFNASLDSQAGIYAVKRMRNKTLQIKVDFATPIDGWDNEAARAHTISLNVPFEGEERVVAGETNDALLERYGPAIGSSRGGMYFGVAPETSNREVAAECQKAHGEKLPTEVYRTLINQLSDETGIAIDSYCPHLRDAFIETNAQRLSPSMQVELKPGRRDIAYKLYHPLVRRNSVSGEQMCIEHGNC